MWDLQESDVVIVGAGLAGLRCASVLEHAGLSVTELESMGGRVAVAATALRTMQLQRVMERLVQRGVLQIASFTPTDAAHVVGLQHTYDASAARKAANLFARRRDRLGKAIATDAVALAQLTVDTLVRRSGEAVLAAAPRRAPRRSA